MESPARLHLVPLLALVAVSLAAPPGRAESETSRPDWAGSAWQVDEIEGDAVVGDVVLTLAFPDEGTVAGSGGCNRYSGSIRLDGDTVAALGPLAVTRRACPEPISSQEVRFLDALSRARRLAHEGAIVRIYGEGDAPLLRLRPDVAEGAPG